MMTKNCYKEATTETLVFFTLNTTNLELNMAHILISINLVILFEFWRTNQD